MLGLRNRVQYGVVDRLRFQSELLIKILDLLFHDTFCYISEPHHLSSVEL